MLLVHAIEHERRLVAPVDVARFELEDRGVDRVGEADFKDLVAR